MIGISTSVINCPTSYSIQAKANGTILYNPAHVLSVTGNRVVFNYIYPPDSLTNAGLICDNGNYTEANEGPAQTCKDYSVRFCCPTHTTKPDETSKLICILNTEFRGQLINFTFKS